MSKVVTDRVHNARTDRTHRSRKNDSATRSLQNRKHRNTYNSLRANYGLKQKREKYCGNAI